MKTLQNTILIIFGSLGFILTILLLTATASAIGVPDTWNAIGTAIVLTVLPFLMYKNWNES